jgi:hypothetical protein
VVALAVEFTTRFSEAISKRDIVLSRWAGASGGSGVRISTYVFCLHGIFFVVGGDHALRTGRGASTIDPPLRQFEKNIAVDSLFASSRTIAYSAALVDAIAMEDDRDE